MTVCGMGNGGAGTQRDPAAGIATHLVRAAGLAIGRVILSLVSGLGTGYLSVSAVKLLSEITA